MKDSEKLHRTKDKLLVEHGLYASGDEDGSVVVRDRDGSVVVAITSELLADEEILDRAMQLAAMKVVLMRMGLWNYG